VSWPVPQLLRDRTVLVLSISAGTVFTALGMIIPVRVLYAQSRGASLAIVAAMASSYLLSNFAFQYPVGWLADRFGTKRIMVVGLLGQAGLTLVYLAISDPILFIILRFGEGMLGASFTPPAQAIIAESVRRLRVGRVSITMSS